MDLKFDWKIFYKPVFLSEIIDLITENYRL